MVVGLVVSLVGIVLLVGVWYAEAAWLTVLTLRILLLLRRLVMWVLSRYPRIWRRCAEQICSGRFGVINWDLVCFDRLALSYERDICVLRKRPQTGVVAQNIGQILEGWPMGPGIAMIEREIVMLDSEARRELEQECVAR